MNPVVRQAALEVISSQFGGIDLPDMADSAIRTMIDGLCLGGWSKFERDHTPLPTVSQPLTTHQLIGKIHTLTGYRPRLGMFEEVEQISLNEGSIMILVRTARVTEHFNEYRIRQQGRRLISLTFEAECGCPDQPECECAYSDGYWNVWEEEVWEKESDLVYKRGHAPTADDQHDRLEWERMCYRPGNARTPLDNYYATDSKKMEKHWGA